MTKTIRIDFSYIGTQYLGWQTQNKDDCVQDRVEAALQTILRHPVRVLGASRTDTGVHAEHQVAVFKTAAQVDPGRLLKSLNAILPRDMGVHSVQEVDGNFHPIGSCKAKAYRYRLWTGRGKHAFLDPYVWRLFQPLDLEKLTSRAQEFLGTHDFTSFCATDSNAKTRERTILDIGVDHHGELIDIWIIGDGFLKQMVRSMVGTLVELASSADSRTITQLLAAKDRTKAGVTAPAQGLCLVRLFYESVPTLKMLQRQSERGYTMPLGF